MSLGSAPNRHALRHPWGPSLEASVESIQYIFFTVSAQQWPAFDLWKCCSGLNFPCSIYCVFSLAWLDPDWHRIGPRSGVWVYVDLWPCSWQGLCICFQSSKWDHAGLPAGWRALWTPLLPLRLPTWKHLSWPQIFYPLSLLTFLKVWGPLYVPLCLSPCFPAPLWWVVMPSSSAVASVCNYKIIPLEDFSLRTGSVGSWVGSAKHYKSFIKLSRPRESLGTLSQELFPSNF